MHAKTYLLSQFDYDKATNQLTTEASQLADAGELFGLLQSGRSGIKILSQKSGATHEFRIADVEFDSDDDIVAWQLSSTTIDTRVVIYND